MLTHLAPHHSPPARVVLIGAHGFIGQALTTALAKRGISTLALTSKMIDLAAPNADKALAKLIAPNDAVVMLAALTPDKGRDIGTFMKNSAMGTNVCAALMERRCDHLIYISSDAVYGAMTTYVNETSTAEADDLYGTMHKAREVMFRTTLDIPLAVLRPTMIHGANDTHNSYGPNRFRRQAAKDGKITLGGNGEETRDHIYVDDVTTLISLVLAHRSVGTLNLATGRSISFFDLARKIASFFDKPIEIAYSSRRAPITHRSFDVTAIYKSFPTFTFTSLEEGLAAAHQTATTSE